jgi:hypothetical protein
MIKGVDFMMNKQFGAVLELLARLIEEGAKDSQGAAEIIRALKSEMTK